jgi:ribosomal protein L7/L12
MWLRLNNTVKENTVNILEYISQETMMAMVYDLQSRIEALTEDCEYLRRSNERYVQDLSQAQYKIRDLEDTNEYLKNKVGDLTRKTLEQLAAEIPDDVIQALNELYYSVEDPNSVKIKMCKLYRPHALGLKDAKDMIEFLYSF